MLGHILRGVWTIRRHFPEFSETRKKEYVEAWARQMLGLLAIKLVVHGSPPEAGPVLLVANHISWLDIVVLHAARHCRFISKADVQHWPLVGTLANGAATVYIARESRRDAMRVVHRMAQCLQHGEVLAIFPEGTTSDGVTVLPFHANLLQAAISTGAPVQPVSLQFVDAESGALSLAPCYIGNDTLLASLWRTLCAQGVVAVVRFGELQYADGRERRTWASDLRATITALRETDRDGAVPPAQVPPQR
jgi:1-acyl-sn-glycerol-3-phosphate acyltransferase